MKDQHFATKTSSTIKSKILKLNYINTITKKLSTRQLLGKRHSLTIKNTA